MWTKDSIPDQSGKTAIVTGANAGIGFETALALYQAGAHVILASRRLENVQGALARIQQNTEAAPHRMPENLEDPLVRIQEQKGKGTLETGVLDLSSLDSVKRFAGDFIKRHGQLDILINNAGVMYPPASFTAEGYELQIGVNFLGHFALTGYLYPLLKATPHARVVTVSSLAYLRGAIDFDNLRSEISYDPVREYGRSKLANLLFSFELQRRIDAAGDGVLSIAAQPGANKTDLVRHMSPEAFSAAVERVGQLMDPWQGALPSLYAAVSPDVIKGGFYGPDQDGGYRGHPAAATVAPNALDEGVARRLWAWAENAAGLHYPAI